MSETQRGLYANTAALAGSRLVVAALGWAGSILVVRNLSAEQWGQFTFVFSMLALLSFATELGSSRVVLRHLNATGTDRAAYTGTYLLLRTGLGLLAYVLALTFVVAAGYPGAVIRATAIAGVISVIASFSSGLDIIFQQAMRLSVVAVGTVLGQTVQLAATAVVALARPSLLWFVVPAILFDVVAAAWKLSRAGRFIRPRYNLDPRSWASIMRQAVPLATGQALVGLYTGIDVVLLSQLDTFEAVGFYGVATKFLVIVAFLPTAATTPLITLLVRAWPDDRRAFHDSLNQGLLLMSIIAGLIVTVFAPLAPAVISSFYGARYESAALAAVLTVVSGCVAFFPHVVTAGFIAMGRNRFFIYLGLVGLGTSVVANVVLIPLWSYEGAAAAHMVTSGALLVTTAVLVQRVSSVRRLDAGPLLKVAACTAAALVVGVLAARALPWPLAAAVTAAAYVVLIELTSAAGAGGLRSLLRTPAQT